ncbi:TrlF family AAA-like ATPase [Clostridium sp.]|uniref:TrlF family AAA-like ATPase n=1 Tax=Clostridium sp. TaxID=1506 RepID=UPI003D6D33F5
MNIVNELNTCLQGAEFYRSDLHIHSYGEVGSYDVIDEDMIPSKIIDIALKENLRIISITDHNSIGNVDCAVKYGKDKGVLVIPGVELSTPQGHLLIYCPDFNSLNKFISLISISEDKKICNTSFFECLDKAKTLNGFGIAAHIDTNGGFEIAIEGYTPHKEQIVKHDTLLGLEISSIDNHDWYTLEDVNNDRKLFFKNRITKLQEENDYNIAKVMSSDSHTIKSLGKNILGNKKLTRIKMNELSFDSLRIALKDCGARVRIEESIPETFPHFLGMKLNGGLLDEQIVRFSKNFTCIIGGRGTGKSTMLESLRAVSGNNVKTDIVNSEIWADNIALAFKDETNSIHNLCKATNNDVVNVDDNIEGIKQIPIESYGQGETAETIQHCDKNPQILLSFMDNLLDLDELKLEEKAIIENLKENKKEIKILIKEVENKEEIKNLKIINDLKIKTLEDQKVGEVVKLQSNLAVAIDFRKSINENLNKLVKEYRSILSNKNCISSILDTDLNNLIIGKEEFDNVKLVLNEFATKVDNISSKLQSELDQTISQLLTYTKTWQAKEKEIQDKIEIQRIELLKSNIKLDLVFINKITIDSVKYSNTLKIIALKEIHLNKLLEERNEMVDERKEIRNDIYKIRSEFSKILTKNLKETIKEFFVTVKFKKGLLSLKLQEFLKETMGWRTTSVTKATIITNNISLFDLLDIIEKRDTSRLTNLKDSEGFQIISYVLANDIIDELGKVETKLDLEDLIFEDLPYIILTKKVGDEYFNKEFSKLSLGQQQSILLSILLFSDSKQPLIIDQPEDNLDSEFIYKTLVKALRRIKEHRQVIIVTHNANIAVLGDADLIIPLESIGIKSIIKERGAIDSKKTKERACSILEGSEKAFNKRKEIYGI